MPDTDALVHDLLLPDSNTRRFHAGDACQWLPPVPESDVEPQVAAMIAAHRAEIHAPGARSRGRFGQDEDGNPIETSYLGVGVDPESGAVFALDNDGNRVEAASEKAARRASEKDRGPRPATEARPQPRQASSG